MSKPLVSIIIPTYNRAHLIGETLDSILAQTYSNWECIIVDDSSTDKTAQVINNYIENDKRFQFHNRPANRHKGANSCRNYGFELSKGEYVNWFDDDDIMLKDKLSLQIKALENSTNNFSICQALVFEGEIHNVLGFRHKKIVSENSLLDFIKHEIVFMTPSALIKSKFLTDSKLIFDEELQAAQEWEFFCRLLHYDPNYHVTNLPLVLIRKHFSSISYNPSNAVDRKWHYYLARKKIYNFMLHKQSEDKKTILTYLQSYFSMYLKSVSFQKNSHRIWSVFFTSYVPFNSFLKNLNTFSILLLIFFTGRGYNLTGKF